jgi:hypothetical protein
MVNGRSIQWIPLLNFTGRKTQMNHPDMEMDGKEKSVKNVETNFNNNNSNPCFGWHNTSWYFALVK